MRTIRTRIIPIPVKTWFPSNNPVAVVMARLCVLREDLYLELKGMIDKPIAALDECSSQSREIYFFRNSVRTLLEIRSAVETLKQKKSFMLALTKQPYPLNGAVNKLAKALNEAHGIVKKLRNEVAGHLPQKAIEEALHVIDPATRGLLQIGDTAKEIHYKFIVEILGATMLRHVPYKDAEREWQKILKTTIELSFDALRAIDRLLASYSRIYKLNV